MGQGVGGGSWAEGRWAATAGVCRAVLHAAWRDGTGAG